METTTGPITLADVRNALGGTNPSHTNAGPLRKIMGRGSMATVQKHLDAIRAERAAVVPEAQSQVPAAPVEAVAAIWGAAWAQAQVLALTRLASLTTERDAAQALVIMQGLDIASLTGEVDDLMAAAQTRGCEQVQGLAAAQTLAAKQGQALASAQSELERVTTAANSAATLAAREAQIERQALQATIDRLTDQASDLKSLLARLSPTLTA
jgi:hypothetical protein